MAVFKEEKKLFVAIWMHLNLEEKEQNVSSLETHLLLEPYISSRSQWWKNLTHIWIKIAWHYLSLWFLHHLDYVAKTRKTNVSRNKPEFNKMILVSTSNFTYRKQPASSAACICFYIFVETDTHQSSLFLWQLSTTNLQQGEEKP